MKEFFSRRRNLVLIGGSLLVLLFQLLTDPNRDGSITVVFIAQLVSPIIAVWFAYLARKALFDYIDMEELYIKAKESRLGSALIFLSLAIVLSALLGIFGPGARAADVATTIPAKAEVYLPTVKRELSTLWINHPKDLR